MADELTIVRSGLSDRSCAIMEHDELHPGGYVFVYGNVVAEVGNTPEVSERLRSGVLVRASASDLKAYEAGKKAKLARAAQAGGPTVAAQGDVAVLSTDVINDARRADLAQTVASVEARIDQLTAQANDTDDEGTKAMLAGQVTVLQDVLADAKVAHDAVPAAKKRGK